MLLNVLWVLWFLCVTIRTPLAKSIPASAQCHRQRRWQGITILSVQFFVFYFGATNSCSRDEHTVTDPLFVNAQLRLIRDTERFLCKNILVTQVLIPLLGLYAGFIFSQVLLFFSLSIGVRILVKVEYGCVAL